MIAQSGKKKKGITKLILNPQLSSEIGETFS
jgi:hypothetical protein